MLKIAMTSISLGAGFGGGVFSPALFIGAMTGGAVGMVASWVIPTTMASHGLFAIIGMGAVAGAVLGAPISTFLIVFELVADYQLSIAIMVATMIASIITRRTGTLSFFHAQLEGRGLKLRGGRARHIIQTMNLADLIRSDHRALNAQDDLARTRMLMALSRHSTLLVVDEDNHFQGIITPDTLTNLDEDGPEPTAGSLAIQPSQPLYRDDSLQKALSIMDVTQESMLPVLAGHDDDTLVGILTHRDALAAYNRLLLEEREEEHDEQR